MILSSVSCASENRTAAGIDRDDFSIIQCICSVFSTDDSRNTEGDGNDGRFTRKAGFFGNDGAGTFHVFYKISTSGAENQDAAVGEVLFQIFQRFGNANFTDSDLRPMPVPRRRTSPTTWTRIMLVEPALATGTPAVRTTRSPALMRSLSRAAKIALSTTASESTASLR